MIDDFYMKIIKFESNYIESLLKKNKELELSKFKMEELITKY